MADATTFIRKIPATKSVFVERAGTKPGVLVGGAPMPVAHRHVQEIPTAVWTVTHGLGFYPNVSVVDSGGTQVVGGVQYLSRTQVQLTFSDPFAGEAYFS